MRHLLRAVVSSPLSDYGGSFRSSLDTDLMLVRGP
jgi:hypothetical protein